MFPIYDLTLDVINLIASHYENSDSAVVNMDLSKFLINMRICKSLDAIYQDVVVGTRMIDIIIMEKIFLSMHQDVINKDNGNNIRLYIKRLRNITHMDQLKINFIESSEHKHVCIVFLFRCLINDTVNATLMTKNFPVSDFFGDMCYYGTMIGIHFKYLNIIDICCSFLANNDRVIYLTPYITGISGLIMSDEYFNYCFKKIYRYEKKFNRQSVDKIFDYVLQRNSLELMKYLIPIVKASYGDVYQGTNVYLKDYYENFILNETDIEAFTF